MILLEIDSTNEHNKFVDEWSAHGQSDINLEHKGQVVADTGINRPVKNGSVLGRFFCAPGMGVRLGGESPLQAWQ